MEMVAVVVVMEMMCSWWMPMVKTTAIKKKVAVKE